MATSNILLKKIEYILPNTQISHKTQPKDQTSLFGLCGCPLKTSTAVQRV